MNRRSFPLYGDHAVESDKGGKEDEDEPAKRVSNLTPSGLSAIAMSGRRCLVRDSVLLIWQTVPIHVGVVVRRVKAMIPNI